MALFRRKPVAADPFDSMIALTTLAARFQRLVVAENHAMSPGLCAKPILGVRGWQTYGGEYICANNGETWPVRYPLLARCREQQDHRPPVPGCTCGIYAVDSLDRVSAGDLAGGYVVLGLVALWGRIVVHATGYRAQYAYPVALVLHPEPAIPLPPGFRWERPDHEIERAKLTKRCAERYGVPALERWPER